MKRLSDFDLGRLESKRPYNKARLKLENATIYLMQHPRSNKDAITLLTQHLEKNFATR